MVNNIKDLKKLIQLCRSTGVEAIEVPGCKMNLGPTPVIVRADKRTKQVREEGEIPTFPPGGITEDTSIPTDGLTDEQLLYYSAQGHTNEQQ